MFFYAKPIKTRVAKYAKIPTDKIHQKDIRFIYPEQHFFYQQAAYVFYINTTQSSETTERALLLQKRKNLLLYLKLPSSALRALLTLSSSIQKHRETHYKLSSFVNNLPNIPMISNPIFLGVDNELYVVYETNDKFIKIAKISDYFVVYNILSFEKTEKFGFGLPLYNNYIPIAIIENKTFVIMVYDIINHKKYKIDEFDVQFLEDQLSDYVKKLTGRDISNSVRRCRESYEILAAHRSSYTTSKKIIGVCSNLSLCETMLYITNRNVNEDGDHVVFAIKFTFSNEDLYYELSIPREASFRYFELEKMTKKYVIKTKKFSIRLPKGNYTISNIAYYRDSFLVLRDFVYNNSYYILDLRNRANKKISYYNPYGMRFYAVDNIVLVAYLTATKLSRGRATWHLLIYDTIKRRFYNTLINDWYEGASADLLSYYYIEKCKKVVLVVGTIRNNLRDFYNTEQNKTAHTVIAITILDLSKISEITDNDDIEKCKETLKFPFFIQKYIRDKGIGDAYYVQADCAVDVNKSMLYITAFVPDYQNPVITIAKNLCDNKNRFYDFDLGVPILRTRNITKDKNKPIYTSENALKRANFPRYLNKYDWRGFYNFINSKTMNTDLIFIAYPDFTIIDRHYHRKSQFYKEFSNFYLTESLLIDTYLAGYCIVERESIRVLAGVFIISDLTIVRET